MDLKSAHRRKIISAKPHPTLGASTLPSPDLFLTVPILIILYLVLTDEFENTDFDLKAQKF